VTGSHAQEKIRIVKSLHVSWEGLSFSIKWWSLYFLILKCPDSVGGKNWSFWRIFLLDKIKS
jgi:hypothetical protein